MMFDMGSLVFLLFVSLLGLGGIFMVLRYFFKQQGASKLPPDAIANSGEIEALRQECLRLREQLQQQSTELTADLRESTFQQLQTLFINYPTVLIAAQAKPDLPAKNLTSLFTPLDNLLQNWGYETIGSAWEQVPYNPHLHQPDAGDIAEGELVYIRFVGYRLGDSLRDSSASRIICPAKVSRTLPGGAK